MRSLKTVCEYYVLFISKHELIFHKNISHKNVANKNSIGKSFFDSFFAHLKVILLSLLIIM